MRLEAAEDQAEAGLDAGAKLADVTAGDCLAARVRTNRKRIVVRIRRELDVVRGALMPTPARLHDPGVRANIREPLRVRLAYLRAALGAHHVPRALVVHLDDVRVHALEVRLEQPMRFGLERLGADTLGAPLGGFHEVRQRVHLFLEVANAEVLLRRREIVGDVLVHAPRIRLEVLHQATRAAMMPFGDGRRGARVLRGVGVGVGV